MSLRRKLPIVLCAVAVASPLRAQQAAQPAGETTLPEVTVTQPKQPAAPKAAPKAKTSAKGKAGATKGAPKAAQAAPPPEIAPADSLATPPSAPAETATGPVQGIVATQSASATKTDTPIIETPQSISVIGAEQVRRLGATSVVEATRYAPGVRSETFGGDTRNDWFLVRGFSAQETGYYLDGLQLFSTAFATWRLEPSGLERIEIIRGPSSVLYGGGNPGGLINAVSKRPTFEDFRVFSTGVDEHGNAFGAVDLGGASGEWSYRVNALGRGGGTQVDDIDNDRVFIAPSLTWRPNPDTTLTLLASYQRDETDIQNFLPYQGTVRRAPFGRIPTELNTNNPGYGAFEREQALVGYEFAHDVNDALTLRQNFRYGHLEVDLIGLYGTGFVGTPTSDSATLARANFLSVPTANQTSVDNQAELRFDTGPLAHKLLAGLDYKYYRIDDESGFEGGTPLDLLDPDYPGISPPRSRYELSQTSQQQLGLYLQDQIKLDRWTLALSGRHDWVHTDREADIPALSSAENGDQEFTGRAGLIYNFDNGLAPYIAYSTSFDPLVGRNFVTGQILEPELGEGFEGGFKYEPRGFPGRFTASFFEITRQNVLTTNPANATQSTQIGEVRSRGFELEGIATLAPGFDLISSYTQYDLEVTDDLNPALIGKVPAARPEAFGGIFLDYTFQYGWLEGFGFGGGVRWVGRSFADPLNTLEVPDYTLADATLHYDSGDWRTQLNVSNVFDDTYVGSCSTPSACFYGERRKAMVTVTRSW